MKTTNNIVQLKILDTIRGGAALYVLVHHARLLLTVPYYKGYLRHPEKYNLLDKLMMYGFSAFKFGHEAVILFFILSGFVIHLKQAGELTSNNSSFSTKKYLLKRILRIYPVLIISMVLTFSLDLLWNYIDCHNPLINSSHYSVETFLFNLFLIPDAPIFGPNYPMWSLKHEWFFYLLYPLLYFFTQKNLLLSLVIPVFGFIAHLIQIKIPLLGEVTHTTLIWWFGALAAEVYTGRYRLKFENLIYLMPSSVIVLFIFNELRPSVHDLLWGFFCMGFLSFAIARLARFSGFIKLDLFGRFSFTIYLMHFPILIFIQNIILKYNNSILPYHLWYAFASCFIAIPILYLLYLLAEYPIYKVKEKNSH